MNSNKELTNKKDIKIEDSSWEAVIPILKKRRIDKVEGYRTTGELVSNLLIRHKEKKIDFQSFEQRERKIRKIELTPDALAYYLNDIATGDKTYLINGLLRTWLKENTENSND